MSARIRCVAVLLVAAMAAPGVLVAQHGHPLVGVWLGEWSPTAEDSTPVLIDMNWENTTLSGVINPGFPDAAEIVTGLLDSKNWTVHIEAEGSDRDGTPVRIVLDGELGDLGSANRTLRGTWIRNGVSGDFSLTRE